MLCSKKQQRDFPPRDVSSLDSLLSSSLFSEFPVPLHPVRLYHLTCGCQTSQTISYWTMGLRGPLWLATVNTTTSLPCQDIHMSLDNLTLCWLNDDGTNSDGSARLVWLFKLQQSNIRTLSYHHFTHCFAHSTLRIELSAESEIGNRRSLLFQTSVCIFLHITYRQMAWIPCM